MTKLNQTPPVIVVGEAIFKIANDYSKKKKLFLEPKQNVNPRNPDE